MPSRPRRRTSDAAPASRQPGARPRRQTALGWSAHRDGRPLVFGWGRDLTRAEKERIKSRLALLALGTVIAVALLLVVGGLFYENVFLARLPAVRVDTQTITMGEYTRYLALERGRLLIQAQNLQDRLRRPIRGVGEEEQQAIRQLFQQQLNSVFSRLSSAPYQLQEDLIEAVLLRQEARRRGWIVTETDLERELKRMTGYVDPAEAAATATAAATAVRTATVTGATAVAPTTTASAAVTPTPVPTQAPTALAAETPGGTATAAPTAATTAAAPAETATVVSTATLPRPTPTLIPFAEYLPLYRQRIEADEAVMREVARTAVLRRKLREALSDVREVQEQVRARHILVPDETAAQAVLQRLQAGEDFAELAKELSTDNGTKDKGGDLGFFPRGVMAKEFEEAAFSLAPGQTSGPVKTEFGYHIIRVEAHDPARKVPPEMLQRITSGAFSRWLEEQKATHTIERFVDSERVAWAQRHVPTLQ